MPLAAYLITRAVRCTAMKSLLSLVRTFENEANEQEQKEVEKEEEEKRPEYRGRDRIKRETRIKERSVVARGLEFGRRLSVRNSSRWACNRRICTRAFPAASEPVDGEGDASREGKKKEGKRCAHDYGIALTAAE